MSWYLRSCIRIIYNNDRKSKFENLQEEDQFVWIRDQNLQVFINKNTFQEACT